MASRGNTEPVGASSTDFWMGVGLMVVGTVFQNVGLGLMKTTHERNKRRPWDLRRAYWRDQAWWMALLLFLAGVLADFIALGLIPASVALPLGSLGIVINTYYAIRFVGENVTRHDVLGTLLIVLGSWSAVLFSSHHDQILTSTDLLDRLSPTHVSGFYTIVAGIWLISLFLLKRVWYYNAVIASAIPGSIGAFGNIGGKGTAELVKTTVLGMNQFSHWFSWIFVFFTVGTLVWQNHYLQAALSTFDQVIVVPIYYVFVCFFSCLGGVLFFEEWAGTAAWQDLLVVGGVALIFWGVSILSLDHAKGSAFPIDYTGLFEEEDTELFEQASLDDLDGV